MWYYAVNGQSLGPISEADLDAQVRSGVLPPNTFVWREGMAEWLPYSSRSTAAPAVKISRAEETAPLANTVEDSAVATPMQGGSLRLESSGSWAMLAIIFIAMFGFLGVLSSRPRIADHAMSALAGADDDETEAFAATARLRLGSLTIRNTGGFDWSETLITFNSSGVTYSFPIDELARGTSIALPLSRFTNSEGRQYESKLTTPEPSDLNLDISDHGTATVHVSRRRR